MGFNDFIRERRYLKKVSPATISWYTKWLPSESPTQSELKDAVLRMREKGLEGDRLRRYGPLQDPAAQS